MRLMAADRGGTTMATGASQCVHLDIGAMTADLDIETMTTAHDSIAKAPGFTAAMPIGHIPTATTTTTAIHAAEGPIIQSKTACVSHILDADRS